MSGLKLWPIVVGILIDIGGSIGASIAYFGAVAAVQAARGGAVDEGALTLGASEFSMLAIVGLLFTATGGFVAAQMAKIRHLQHGIAVGIGSLAVGLLGGLAGGDADADVPAWLNALSYLAVVPAAALGGYLAGRGAPPPADRNA
jgi:hypothetical protein